MSLRRAAATLLGPVVALLLLATSAVAGGVPDPPDGPYLGPVLEWDEDSADAYVERLGLTPSVFGQSLPYPLDADDERFLEQFIEQTAAHGAIAQLSLEPRVPLSDLTTEDATSLGDQLQDLHARLDTLIVLRFAPEMNGSWRAWGQQPTQFREAFRTVSTGVRAQTDAVEMLWAPAYGAGYPFGDAYGASPGSEPRPLDQLDTTGDGLITEADDPYAAYWPGADVVDRVGLVMYRFGFARPFGEDEVPTPTELTDRLAERHGYAEDLGRSSFHDRFAVANDLPMALETAAAWYGSGSATTERAVKEAWWQQLLDPDLRQAYPALDLVTWWEVERPEPEADDAVTDWRTTADPDIAQAFATALREGATTGPVTEVHERAAAAGDQDGAGSIDWGEHAGPIVFGVLMVGVVAAVVVASRRATG